MFNVGDRVIVHKPRNGIKNFTDEPMWVSSMDRYNGTEQTVSRIYNHGKWIELAGGQRWTYGYSWLSPVVPTIEDDDFEVEDLECLM